MKTLKILTGLALLIVISAFAADNFNLLDDGYAIGDTVDDFSLKNVDGEMVSLSDYKDAKGFIVVFTCNTCPFAQANEDRILQLDIKYKASGYPVIAINPNDAEVKRGEDFAAMQNRARSNGYTFPYLMDGSNGVHARFGAVKTPTVFVLQKNASGESVVRYMGSVDDSARDAATVNEKFVENAVDALLEGKQVKKTTTKAIGCGIKA
ncbi:MAG: thioredoxin family protein [Cytophagaceae bacterium]|nr:thioredoxin family protein [Cytophagaceae bacterium]|tara:strand:+ start:4500 stop:5123 length:624 start_codon:yes stop_codon:yes gene_type:complete